MTQTVTDRVKFAPDRTTLAVVLIAALGALPLGLSSPYLAPLLLLPVAAFVWVLRARVTATREGLEICNGLLVRRMAWAEVDRFDLPARGPVLLHTTKGRSVRLTALARQDLRRLIKMGTPA